MGPCRHLAAPRAGAGQRQGLATFLCQGALAPAVCPHLLPSDPPTPTTTMQFGTPPGRLQLGERAGMLTGRERRPAAGGATAPLVVWRSGQVGAGGGVGLETRGGGGGGRWRPAVVAAGARAAPAVAQTGLEAHA